jgi:SAM-dependent methyltransferase
MRLNLGAADRRIEGFISVDIAPPADQIVDLAGPWPWPDSSVDEVLALDVCEHLPSRVHFVNELHRVLKPGARAIIHTPNAARGCGFWQDPTHITGWCLSSFKYFEHGAFAWGRLGRAYGITAAFRVIELTQFETNGEDPREKSWKIKAILEAVKP